MKTTGKANQLFALQLFHALQQENPANLIFSPCSVWLALAMCSEGARGRTASQMEKTLSCTDTLNSCYDAVQHLQSLLSTAGHEESALQLRLASSLWYQQGYPILPAFRQKLESRYGAALHSTDFKTQGSRATEDINRWAARQTQGMIEDIIPPQAIGSMTRLLLANAIHFSAGWQSHFEPAATRLQPFYLPDGTQVQTRLMAQNDWFAYAQSDGCQLIQLPYRGDSTSIIILLPEIRHFEQVRRSLSSDFIDGLTDRLKMTPVDLTMPSFEIDGAFALAHTLTNMGIGDAFTYGKADFSGMDGSRQLFLSDVFHRARIRLDETGTEASAASAAFMTAGAAPGEEEEPVPVVFRADHPFFFFIKEHIGGSILFMGCVLKP